MKKKEKEIPIIELSTLLSILIWVCVIAFLTLLGYGILLIFLQFMVFISPSSYIREHSPDFYPARIEILQESPTIPEPKFKTYQVGCEYWNGYVDTMEATEEEKAWLKKIIYCESRCNPFALSYMSAEGILQFTVPTWIDFGGDRDIKNPYHQLEVGLEMYRKGLQNRWCCNDLI